MEAPTERSTNATAWRSVVGIIALGTMVRLLLAGISYGSTDARTWYRIASYCRVAGLLPSYTITTANNHPLLPVCWAELASAIGGANGFPFVFKLPYIAFDAGSAWLAASIAQRCGGTRSATAAAAAVALSPIAILISGYHGNSDSGYAFFMLLSASLLLRERFFFAALALGAAINVKLVPVMLVPLAFSFCRRWRDAGRMLAGLALAVLPFMPLLIHPSIVRPQMLKYQSCPDRWGIVGLCMELTEIESLRSPAWRVGMFYVSLGRYAILASLLALAAVNFKTRRWSPPQMYLLGCLAFLILAPGFGLQYMTMLVPLLAVMSVRGAWVYGIAAGVFAGLAYALSITQGFPLFSDFNGPLPQPAAIVGFATWGILIWLVIRLVFRGSAPTLPA